MRTRITEQTLKRRPPEAGTLEIWDTVLPGFGLRIGARRRTFFIMTRIGGRQVRRKVGTTDSHGLAEARDLARDMLETAAGGTDPAAAARQARQDAERLADRRFRAVAAEFMSLPAAAKRNTPQARAPRKDLASGRELQRKLDRDILPALGDLQIDAIDRADIARLIRGKARTSPVAANRVLSLLRTIFRFAIREGYVEVNPAEAVDLTPEASRDRVLTAAEIRAFWLALDGGVDLDPSTRVCLKFLLATGQRRAEAAGAVWAEFDFERDLWLIPAERTKNGRPHFVPLSGLALDLLDEMAAWGGGDHVFPGAYGRGGLTPYAVSQGMLKALPAMDLPGGKATPHDLRRTMVTELNETLGIEPHVVEAMVNHISGAAKAGVAGVYNRATYLEQRRLAFEAWGTRLAEIVADRPKASNVVALRAAE